jgi:hypothetical protein
MRPQLANPKNQVLIFLYFHEAIDNVTPAHKYYGRDSVILKKREKVRKETMKMRSELNRMAILKPLPNGVS